MLMTMYKTFDSENVINKTLVQVHELSIKLKQNTDVTMPTIHINNNKEIRLLDVNYCYLDEFDRYYFIRSIAVENNILSYILECDVLESFKADILTSVCEFSRGIREGDYQEVARISDVRKEIDTYDSPVSLVNNNDMILTTIGGE